MNKAFRIANDNLCACFEDDGIVASIDHYNDFWARDAFYASWGLLEIGEFEKVKSNLKLFIKYQKKDGQIPRRIDRFFVGLKYLGIRIKRKNPKPKYSGVYFCPALDPNLLFVITCYKYIEKTSDLDFLRENFGAIASAVKWLQKYESGSLLNEGLFSNWADTVIKIGAVLYTNVLYVETLRGFSEMNNLLGNLDEAKEYSNKQQELKEKINREFWNGNYYIDWIGKNKKHDYFSTDGNVLAMLFEIADRQQEDKLIEWIEKCKLDEIPLKNNYPKYPWWRVALRMYAIGASGYQNNFASWLWLGCVYAVALHKKGRREKARIIHQKISSKIEEYDMVYEIYSPNGLPFGGWYWKSATSFAWSSGLYLWMERNLEG